MCVQAGVPKGITLHLGGCLSAPDSMDMGPCWINTKWMKWTLIFLGFIHCRSPGVIQGDLDQGFVMVDMMSMFSPGGIEARPLFQPQSQFGSIGFCTRCFTQRPGCTGHSTALTKVFTIRSGFCSATREDRSLTASQIHAALQGVLVWTLPPPEAGATGLFLFV